MILTYRKKESITRLKYIENFEKIIVSKKYVPYYRKEINEYISKDEKSLKGA